MKKTNLIGLACFSFVLVVVPTGGKTSAQKLLDLDKPKRLAPIN